MSIDINSHGFNGSKCPESGYSAANGKSPGAMELDRTQRQKSWIQGVLDRTHRVKLLVRGLDRCQRSNLLYGRIRPLAADE